jgi:hypothetical protein
MKRVKLEADLLRYALGVFKNTTGIDYELEKIDKGPAGQMPDTMIRLKKDGVEYLYAVEVKARLTNTIIGAVIDRVRRFPQKGVIITDYVNPNIADKLREMEIAFIDVAGNAYIKEPGLYLFIKGNKPGGYAKTDTFETEEMNQTIYAPLLTIAPQFFPPTIINQPKNQAFQPVGLKVVFAFLCDRETINAPYREIAKATDVALGTVGWVIRNLKEQGLLVEIKKDKRRKLRRIVDRKKLLEKWVEAYNEKLRPTLIIGRYTTPQNYWWQNTDIRNYGARWGGEVAAAELTDYLKPEIATVYANEMPVQLLRDLRMRHDPNGNVEIMRQFWDNKFNPDNQKRENKYIDIAPVIIVYADLLATGDARNLETAGILYDKEIAGFIGEN